MCGYWMQIVEMMIGLEDFEKNEIPFGGFK